MRISVSSENVKVNEKTHEHIQRCIYFAMGRFGTAIERVEVRVADINGPRGGIDKRCQIIVKLFSQGSNPIVVSATEDSLSAAIVYASDRAGRTVGRAIERRRQKRKKNYPILQPE